MTPGIKTTEFWATVGINVANLAMSIQGALPPKYEAIVGGVTTVIYTIARAFVKAA